MSTKEEKSAERLATALTEMDRIISMQKNLRHKGFAKYIILVGILDPTEKEASYSVNTTVKRFRQFMADLGKEVKKNRLIQEAKKWDKLEEGVLRLVLAEQLNWDNQKIVLGLQQIQIRKTVETPSFGMIARVISKVKKLHVASPYMLSAIDEIQRIDGQEALQDRTCTNSRLTNIKLRNLINNQNDLQRKIDEKAQRKERMKKAQSQETLQIKQQEQQ
ncbi:hypothetical protein OXYTRIMIC_285 [Oxytricha trifallax]|uniref:Uncharacterized protein n=1 Tax=Oxytricha trifallax TaxID=1172189 RepID=A0A073IBI8_9SPIT|nr:hypothetical protein OXYTRIMIC_285 [Oxytricha trifallax]